MRRAVVLFILIVGALVSAASGITVQFFVASGNPVTGVCQPSNPTSSLLANTGSASCVAVPHYSLEIYGSTVYLVGANSRANSTVSLPAYVKMVNYSFVQGGPISSLSNGVGVFDSSTLWNVLSDLSSVQVTLGNQTLTLPVLIVSGPLKAMVTYYPAGGPIPL
ncbi:MAG: hypothetical protein QW767_04710 [Thermoprotei archaeon]